MLTSIFGFGLLILGAASAATPQTSAAEVPAGVGGDVESAKEQTLVKDFVLVKSSSNYKEAVRSARLAAKRLSLRLDLRDLSPHGEGGLTYPRSECEEHGFEYPCYVARGRDDDGAYVSLEYSTAYASFKPGMYIVIVASDDKGGQIVKDALKAAKKVFKDAYVRRSDVYVGCIH